MWHHLISQIFDRIYKEGLPMGKWALIFLILAVTGFILFWTTFYMGYSKVIGYNNIQIIIESHKNGYPFAKPIPIKVTIKNESEKPFTYDTWYSYERTLCKSRFGRTAACL